ncbi:MAG: hypothetical protein FWC53_02675 [Firmicutes bacterium]|nr:hypothetical protein [Bacillota bacterium]
MPLNIQKVKTPTLFPKRKQEHPEKRQEQPEQRLDNLVNLVIKTKFTELSRINIMNPAFRLSDFEIQIVLRKFQETVSKAPYKDMPRYEHMDGVYPIRSCHIRISDTSVLEIHRKDNGGYTWHIQAIHHSNTYQPQELEQFPNAWELGFMDKPRTYLGIGGHDR